MERIQRLDPVRDHQQIVRLSTYWDFPFDMQRSLELALFRTYAVASIGGLLHHTGRLVESTQRRYDDTDLLVNEVLEHGYDSERGEAAIARINSLHGRWRIANDDLLYVLSTFVCEPIRWIQRFGWRPYTAIEQEALYRVWAQVGPRMGMREVPDSLDRLFALNTTYERAHFRYSRGGRAVADATRDLLLSWFLPRRLWPLGARAFHALLDEPLLDALRYPHPTRVERHLVAGALQARARTVRLLPARPGPAFRTARARPSYPGGYTIHGLGT